ncbi:MAG: sulfatase-like hydrolase/transferase [Planctomycetota bacterium]
MLSLLLALPLLSCSRQEVVPNILVVVADDLGIDLVNAYGVAPSPPCTPSLDALAEEGLLFRDAWATPYCSPSRAALLTGRHGFRTGIGQPIAAVLSLDEFTLAEGLRDSEERYSTAALGKWHLAGGAGADPMHPNKSGFEHFAGTLDGFVPDYSAWSKITNGKAAPTTVYATVDTTDDALEWIDALPEPWFLYVSYHAPHTPLHHPPAELCPPSTNCPDGFCANLGPASSDVDQLKAMVEVLDDQIGRLADAIDTADTYLFVIGDNGTTAAGSEPPFASEKAKGTVYQGGVKVPLIVLGPGVVPGETSAPVGITDLMATIGDLTRTGLTAEDSVSFVPTLFDPGYRPRSTVYAETFTPNGSTLPIPRHDYTVRDGRFKLLVQHDQPEELYDLTADFFEEQNLLPPATPNVQATYDRLLAEVRVLHDGLDFEATTNAVSLSSGGVQQLILAAGTEAAQQLYWVLGSASGTSPGVPLPAGALPLVLDAYTTLSITGANESPFAATLGTFNDQGTALASVTVAAGGAPEFVGATYVGQTLVGPSLIGTVLNHAYVRLDPQTGAVTGVSGPEPLCLLP